MAFSHIWKEQSKEFSAYIEAVREIQQLLASLFFQIRVKSEVLPEATKVLFEKFESGDLPPNSYLGGGTAIALHLGHRQSVDLDWFTPSAFDEKMWQMRWEEKWNFNMKSREWQTLVGEISQVKTSLFFYNYPLIEDPITFNGLQIATLKDLAAMKLTQS